MRLLVCIIATIATVVLLPALAMAVTIAVIKFESIKPYPTIADKEGSILDTMES